VNYKAGCLLKSIREVLVLEQSFKKTIVEVIKALCYKQTARNYPKTIVEPKTGCLLVL